MIDDLALKLSDEKDLSCGWCFDPDCLQKIQDEYKKRNEEYGLQAPDIELIDDILAIVWEAGLIGVSE